MKDCRGVTIEPGDHVRIVEGRNRGDVGVVFDVDDEWDSVRASMTIRRGAVLDDPYEIDCDGGMLERVRERPRVDDQTGELDDGGLRKRRR